MTRALVGRERAWTGAGVLALCAAAAVGCVANEAATPARGVAVSGPPPAPLNEDHPAPPSAQAAWVAGYWHWTGVQYAWIPGHWEQQVPAGATWAGPRYVSRDGAYFYEPGAWSRPAPAPTQRANALR